MSYSDTNRIIYEAKSSSEALRGLYELEKKANKRRSLAYFCKRAKIPSTGYFSDVLTGKRTINVKYRISITRAFDLSDAAVSSLRLLIDIDNEFDPIRIAALQKKLSVSKKALQVSYLTPSANSQQLFSALNVFCAFGLFGNRPKKTDLETYFQIGNGDEVTDSLELLESIGLIKKDGDLYSLLHDHVIFGEKDGMISHIEFLKLAIAHAAENVTDWFNRKDKSYFTSTVLSVRSEDYLAILKEIKTKMLMAQSELNSANADMLVRFNVQIYPIMQPFEK